MRQPLEIICADISPSVAAPSDISGKSTGSTETSSTSPALTFNRLARSCFARSVAESFVKLIFFVRSKDFAGFTTLSQQMFDAISVLRVAREIFYNRIYYHGASQAARRQQNIGNNYRSLFCEEAVQEGTASLLLTR